MQVTAIIVTFNRLEKLKLTIQRSMGESFDKIIIVNNNSSDGTQEYLDSLKNNQLIIRHLDNNIGGAGGFHVGFEVALEKTSADWIVCYDDDSYPQKGTIDKFRNLKLDGISAIAAAVYLPNGDISVMNKVRFNPFRSIRSFFDTFIKRIPIYVSEEVYKKELPCQIDASTFVGFFVRADVVRQIGLPRTELFIYADDLIYTLGMTSKGHKHMFIPSVKFTHDCTTLVNENDVYDPIWKVYYTYRNRIEMYRVSSRWLYLPITLLQINSWIRQKKYYENQELYLRLLKTAIIDALKRDFTKSHSDILEIVKQYEN
jgi:GT2 family glycosyltransferase